MSDGITGERLAGAVDTDGAEREWRAYAWPVAWGGSGKRTFFVDASGEILVTDGETVRYGGVQGGPRFDAALPPLSAEAGTPILAGGRPGWSGRDGQSWIRVP